MLEKRHKSASQISTFALCPRKWAFGYIDGIKIETPSRELGKAVHAQLEAWLRDSKPLDLATESGEIALSGLHLLPAPGAEGMVIEEPFALEMFGHRLIGIKDVQIPGEIPTVLDHKTTSDFKWAVQNLASDTQAAIYAADAMVKNGTDSCKLKWVYYRTRGPRKALLVEQTVSREDITPTLGWCATIMNSMDRVLLTHTEAKDVTPNPDACNTYGGCEYLPICNTKEHPVEQKSIDDFLASLKAVKPAVNPPPNTVVPTTAFEAKSAINPPPMPAPVKPGPSVVDTVALYAAATKPNAPALAHCADLLESAAKMLRELAK